MVEWYLTTVINSTQNLWRKIQEIVLQADYMHDEDLTLRIRMVPALAFDVTE